MFERSVPILRMICLALAALIVVQVSRVRISDFCRGIKRKVEIDPEAEGPEDPRRSEWGLGHPAK